MGKYYVYSDKTRVLFDFLGVTVKEYEEFMVKKRMRKTLKSSIDYFINGVIEKKFVKIKNLGVIVDTTDFEEMKKYVDYFVNVNL